MGRRTGGAKAKGTIGASNTASPFSMNPPPRSTDGDSDEILEAAIPKEPRASHSEKIGPRSSLKRKWATAAGGDPEERAPPRFTSTAENPIIVSSDSDEAEQHVILNRPRHSTTKRKKLRIMESSDDDDAAVAGLPLTTPNHISQPYPAGLFGSSSLGSLSSFGSSSLASSSFASSSFASSSLASSSSSFHPSIASSSSAAWVSTGAPRTARLPGSRKNPLSIQEIPNPFAPPDGVTFCRQPPLHNRAAWKGVPLSPEFMQAIASSIDRCLALIPTLHAKHPTQYSLLNMFRRHFSKETITSFIASQLLAPGWQAHIIAKKTWKEVPEFMYHRINLREWRWTGDIAELKTLLMETSGAHTYIQGVTRSSPFTGEPQMVYRVGQSIQAEARVVQYENDLKIHKGTWARGVSTAIDDGWEHICAPLTGFSPGWDYRGAGGLPADYEPSPELKGLTSVNAIPGRIRSVSIFAKIGTTLLTEMVAADVLQLNAKVHPDPDADPNTTGISNQSPAGERMFKVVNPGDEWTYDAPVTSEYLETLRELFQVGVGSPLQSTASAGCLSAALTVPSPELLKLLPPSFKPYYRSSDMRTPMTFVLRASGRETIQGYRTFPIVLKDGEEEPRDIDELEDIVVHRVGRSASGTTMPPQLPPLGKKFWIFDQDGKLFSRPDTIDYRRNGLSVDAFARMVLPSIRNPIDQRRVARVVKKDLLTDAEENVKKLRYHRNVKGVYRFDGFQLDGWGLFLPSLNRRFADDSLARTFAALANVLAVGTQFQETNAGIGS